MEVSRIAGSPARPRKEGEMLIKIVDVVVASGSQRAASGQPRYHRHRYIITSSVDTLLQPARRTIRSTATGGLEAKLTV